MNLFILTKCGCPIWRQYYIVSDSVSFFISDSVALLSQIPSPFAEAKDRGRTRPLQQIKIRSRRPQHSGHWQRIMGLRFQSIDTPKNCSKEQRRWKSPSTSMKAFSVATIRTTAFISKIDCVRFPKRLRSFPKSTAFVFPSDCVHFPMQSI